MAFLNKLHHSFFALLFCLVAGSVAGVYAPSLGEFAYVIGQMYLSAVSMAAIPLLVVATFFGLRQTMALPFPGRRILMIAGVALLMVVTCAATGLAFGWVAAPGTQLDTESRSHLGALVLQQGDNGGNIEIRLLGDDSLEQTTDRLWSSVVPDNFFHALAEGRSLGILSCALLFGMGFAALSRTQNNTLNNLFEGAYRALELIITRANFLLPVVAFGMAAHILSQSQWLTIKAMGGFLLHFIALAMLLSSIAIGIIHQRGSQPLLSVLHHLKTPMLVSLVSSSTTASIPHTIEAMSARLGFSRGIVELVVPTASVFLRAGSALYYVLLTLFVANLYDRSLNASDIGMICAGATLAAFASAGNNSLTNVAYAGIVLSMLQLPIEAALALFVAIDLICEGPRNLLTLLAGCALIAIVSAGLPSERITAPEAGNAIAQDRPLQFVFTRAHIVLLTSGSIVAAGLIVLMGISIGIRQKPERPAMARQTQTTQAATPLGVPQ